MGTCVVVCVSTCISTVFNCRSSVPNCAFLYVCWHLHARASWHVRYVICLCARERVNAYDGGRSSLTNPVLFVLRKSCSKPTKP